MNNVCLLGRLTRDPELRYTPQGGVAVVRFTLAVNRRLGKEKRQEIESNHGQTADFISCTAWRQTAELIANYCHQGDQIAVEGRIQTGSYEKDGRRIYTTDVVVNTMDFASRAGGGNYSSNNSYNQDYGNNNYNQVPNQSYNNNNNTNNPPVNSAYNNDDFSNGDSNSGDEGFFPMDNDDIPF